LAWKTRGCSSTQWREWMHFALSKRTTMLLPRYSWMVASLMLAPVANGSPKCCSIRL